MTRSREPPPAFNGLQHKEHLLGGLLLHQETTLQDCTTFLLSTFSVQWRKHRKQKRSVIAGDKEGCEESKDKTPASQERLHERGLKALLHLNLEKGYTAGHCQHLLTAGPGLI